MKKTFLSVALAALATVGMAQSESMEAFKHLGVGVEAGLMGAGVQVAMPVVTDHLVLVVGYNFMPEIKVGTTLNFGTSDLNANIDRMNAKITSYNLSHGTSYSTLDKVTKGSVDADVDATLKMNNVKALLEYYPSANHSFHITAGVMIGNDDLISLHGEPEDGVGKIYTQALSAYDQLKSAGVNVSDIDVRNSVSFNVDDKTYTLDTKGNVDASIAINKVKPYVGIGFGRPVPTKRVGFQFEIGAWMHGTPTIEGPESATNDPDASGIDGIGDIVSKITFYPQMTFRLTGKIF